MRIIIGTLTFITIFSYSSIAGEINRKPGILEEPSDVPTGDQAYLYWGLGEEKPAQDDEVLDGSEDSFLEY